MRNLVKEYDDLCTAHKKLIKEFDKLSDELLRALKENAQLKAEVESLKNEKNEKIK